MAGVNMPKSTASQSGLAAKTAASMLPKSSADDHRLGLLQERVAFQQHAAPTDTRIDSVAQLRA